MSRKISTRENYRVVVTPRRLGDFGVARISESACYADEADRHKQYLDACERIKQHIKRHADDVYSVDIEYDEIFVCKYCGSEWTEKDKNYNGGCCGHDQAAHESSGTQQ